ncbi:MAG: DUF3859 domain-containing protein [Gammaproteobacteria bacterium]|nr:DUF3859 domain-containing protein [Gammaproteobacteria bacterium]NIR84865.1 DUF3859 domain-containing protein [Gammaproteobacteria bacterium]NIR91714.1 DUF3859 domain-containing protein [Gammaproteobacteria bacterium]NIU05912.1 DUF3859 domain-containing protein [Gammaproteobacteria bacterium]NIV52959.1 DUF3859 domain-containing protein [Gammaproteobacteria bacterium]
MNIRPWLFGLILLPPCATLADTSSVNGARVVEYGQYDVVRGERVAATDTAAGYMSRVQTYQRVGGPQIPAEVGTAFGLKYIVEGEPEGEKVTLTVVQTFPPQGVTHPDTSETTHEQRYRRYARVGEETFDGYILSKPWEVVPGRWTIQILHEERLLIEKKFIVEGPDHTAEAGASVRSPSR